MGYCYGTNYKTGRIALSCDFCGRSDGTTKKILCPHGYCSPLAVCPTCKVVGKHIHNEKGEDIHTRCKIQSELYNKKLSEKQLLLDSGEWLRVSALSTDDDRVHVIFRNGKGEEIGRYMRHETYDKLGIGTTLKDYEALEIDLKEAPTNFY